MRVDMDKKRLKGVTRLVNWGDYWGQAFIDSPSVIDLLMRLRSWLLTVIWGICSVLLSQVESRRGLTYAEWGNR